VTGVLAVLAVQTAKPAVKASDQPLRPSLTVPGTNRKVVECVNDCVKCLAAEILAFWGNDSHKGKFVFKLMAKRDAVAAAYLQKNRSSKL